MIEKLKLFIIATWTHITTPEKPGFLKRVHVIKATNRIKKTIVYYPSNDALPEYEVVS